MIALGLTYAVSAPVCFATITNAMTSTNRPGRCSHTPRAHQDSVCHAKEGKGSKCGDEALFAFVFYDLVSILGAKTYGGIDHHDLAPRYHRF